MNDKDAHRYDDIINLPHHVSKKHPRMSLTDRAAQFAPFAALTGHEDAILETARLTEEAPELDESSRQILDMRLRLIREQLADRPDIRFTVFMPDEKKHGGAYVAIAGKVKKIDDHEAKIILEDGRFVRAMDIVAIEGEMFCEGETEF